MYQNSLRWMLHIQHRLRFLLYTQHYTRFLHEFVERDAVGHADYGSHAFLTEQLFCFHLR